MRHNRGRRWARFPAKASVNQRNSPRNTFPPYNFRNNNRPTGNNNITYIGRCRCGYGPNAYYKTSNGKILQYNQINQPVRINSIPKPKEKFSNIVQYNPINQPVQINPIPKPKSTKKTPKELFPPQVIASRICSRCGSQVGDDAYFCTECGNELTHSPYMTKKEQVEFLKEKIRDLKGQIKILKKKKGKFR